MSGLYNIHSITSVKYAAVEADGTIPESFSNVLYGVKEGTATLNIAQRDTTKVFIEETFTPFAVIRGNMAESSLNMELIGVSLTTLAALSGWTRTAADVSNPEKIEIASSDSQVFLALQLTGKNDADEDVVVSIPRAAMNVGGAKTITKSDMVGVDVMSDILQPINSTTGVLVNPIVRIEVGTATA